MMSEMNWQVIRLQDAKPMPWRNGGGTTRELITWPQTQTQSQSQTQALDWKWRASVAQVDQPGPFSSFPGVQRWFAVLSGDGVALTVDGQLHELRQSDPPLAFDGAANTNCELLGGATQDFNLMVQGGAKARMQRVCTEIHTMIKTPKIIAVYALNTGAILYFDKKKVVLKPQSLGFISVAAETVFQLCSTHALLMEIES